MADTERVKPKEIRQARKFLRDNNLVTADISPRSLAIASKRSSPHKKFGELVKIVARAKMAGQGMGQSAQTEDALS